MSKASTGERLAIVFFLLMILLFVAGLINSVAFTTDVFKFGSGLWTNQVTDVIQSTHVYQTTYGALSMLIAGVSMLCLLCFFSNRRPSRASSPWSHSRCRPPCAAFPEPPSSPFQ